MIAWMMYAAVIGALVGIAAVLAERGARRVGIAGRWMWVGAIALTIALPVIALWRPSGSVAPSTESATETVATTRLDPALLATRDRSLIDDIAARSLELVERAGALTATLARNALANRAAFAFWALASLAMLGAIVVAALRLAAARREWDLALLEEQFVRVSDDVGPAVVGFLRGEIVVPAWALDLAPERRGMLLAHEREHLQARDPLLLLGALIALVLVPWNPAMWWQVRRLRLAVEMDCDQRVLRRGGDVRAYGALLIEVGRRSARAPLAAAAFSEPATHLERRIHMMLARTPRWGAFRATVLALAGIAILLVACDLRPPTGLAPENEVAVATLGINGKSFNVNEGTSAADIRMAVEAYHPELLQDQGGRRWVVQLVLDAQGRVTSSGKVLDRPSRIVELKSVEQQTGGRFSALLRVPEGEVELVQDRVPLTAEVATEKVLGKIVELRETRDTTTLNADRIELRKSEIRAMDVDARRELESGVIDARPTTANRIVARPSRQPLAQSREGSLELDKIDADRIESIEVIKGGAITGLTPAVSGVIVIRMKW